MFTGLVEATAIVRGVIPEGEGVRLELNPPDVLLDEPFPRGGSLAINGCCLTRINESEPFWAFQAGRETLSRTNLGTLRAGTRVNVERAVRPATRLGGHLVQGHIDGLGTVRDLTYHDRWADLVIALPPALCRGVINKGSVTVDGVSLTVVETGGDWFSVALIPETLTKTTLGERQPGDAVNIELDVIGKYVEKFVQIYLPQLLRSERSASCH